jgi:phosphate transport system protein
MRLGLQEDLDRLEADLQAEAELVQRALRGTLQALSSGDMDLAGEVIAFDDEVDRAYLALEEAVEELLARQTPVAGDLRLVLAVLHINLHLERSADLCVTICKLARLVAAVTADPLVIEALRAMGEQAEAMLAQAMEALARRDLASAEGLVAMDELIDRANRRLVERILELGADPTRREWGLRMLLISRCLERIGDHAVDIGEQVAYLVTGELREFSDASHPGDGV